MLVLVGIAAITYGFLSDTHRAWSNVLLNNFMFLSLAIGASFWMALQYITQSGWSSQFKRVPEAMGTFINVAAVLFIVMILGIHDLYHHWADPEIQASDALIQHKHPYLNVPFFIIRMVIFFAAWIFLNWLLRKISHKEDEEGGMEYFHKSEYYSKVYIFVLALTFSLGVFDWVMSIEPHWYSALFALKGFVAAFYHGAATIALIVIILHKLGYFPTLNGSHMLDFSRYIFMLSIVWGYFFFAEFMLIWYGNIPEETVYFAKRAADPTLRVLFFVNIGVNWFLPFIILFSQEMDRKINVVMGVAILLLIGQYLDLFFQIMPAGAEMGEVHFHFGLVEIGTFLGYLGLFAYFVGHYLGKVNLIPKNHPYLEESLQHHLH